MDGHTRANFKSIAGWLARGFPVALGIVATFFLLGQIGFWADDYFHNRRALDGAVPPIEFTSRWPFWPLGIDRGFFIRPIYYQIIPALTTLLWERAWAAHLIQAMCHAGVVVLVWRFMIVLGVGRAAARVAALVFLVYPASYEVFFWVAAIPTALASAAMLGVFFLLVGFARSERRGWWRIAVMGAATFGVCCLNEQPATAVAAMPLLYGAALPARQRFFARRHVARWAAAAIACGMPVLIYVVLITTTAVPGARGSAESFTSLGEFPTRLSHFGENLVRGLLMRDFGSGAWKMGVETVSGAGTVGWAMLVVLGATALSWIVRRETETGPRFGGTELRPWWTAGFGLMLFIAGWVPVVLMVVYEPDSRMRYWPGMGLVIGVAALLSGKGGEWRGWRVIPVRCVLVAVLLWWVVMHLGIQTAFRIRWERDQSEGAQLRTLVPNPQPFTLFQPVDVKGTGLATGASHFDEHFHGVWWYPWTTRRFIQLRYGREDISAVYFQREGEPVLGGNELGLLYRIGLGPRYATKEESGWRVPWGQMLPFVVEADGKVRVVTAFVIDGGRVEVPQAAGQPEFVMSLPRR